MELLTIKHQDFTMSIECSKFGAIWQKAASNVGVEISHLLTRGLKVYCL